MNNDDVILRIVHVTKQFPGVRALDNVSLEVQRGEVHALVGENGAGKSTLIKILAGIYTLDEGQILLDGKRLEINEPSKAQQMGLAFVHQDPNLIPGFTVAQNIFLSREKTNRAGLLDWRSMNREAEQLLHQFGIALDVRRRVKYLGVAQQQLVALAKALSLRPRLIVFDEPTAPLAVAEVESLCAVIRSLKQYGVTVIYISHRLEEICQLCDRVTVLRDGQVVGTVPGATGLTEIIRMMIGSDLGDKFYKEEIPIGDVMLEVRELGRYGKVDCASFSVRKGEVLGIGGLLGSGRSELLRLIFGADRSDAGQVLLDGQPVAIRTPREALQHGIALIPEDRRGQGVVMDMTVRENITLANMRQYSVGGFMLTRPELVAVRRLVDKLGIKTSGINKEIKYLSGGNQQKTVVAKWLCRKASVFLFDEPTKGLDVGAKMEIYRLIADLARDGAAVILVSSETPELLGVCDRILVMRRGRVVAELNARAATQEEILSHSAGEGVAGCKT